MLSKKIHKKKFKDKYRNLCARNENIHFIEFIDSFDEFDAPFGIFYSTKKKEELK